MSEFTNIVFTFQVLALLGSLASNGYFAAKDNKSSSDLKIFHAEIYPDQRPQKCCASATKVYSFTRGRCLRLNEDETQIWATQISKQLPFLNLTATIECESSVILDEFYGHNFTLLGNGMLYEHVRNKTHDHDHFCFDYIQEYERFMPIVCLNKSETGNSEQNYHSEAQTAVLLDGCHSPDPETANSKAFQRQYLYGLGFSSFFLIITFCLYLILPDMHYHEFDWSIMCHIASLIIGFGCIIVGSQIGNYDVSCVPLAYMRQFWILSSFCWLNVMGIYLWRSMYPQKMSGTFHIVWLYAVGCPSLVSLITLMATKLNMFDGAMKPGFEKNCWFQGLDGDFWLNPKFIYFYNTIFVTIAINVGLFLRIAFKILVQNPASKPTVGRNEIQYDRLYMRFFLCLKLSLLMGLSWIIDMVSFLVKEEELRWRLKSLAVLLHGVFIFIIFVSNKRVTTVLFGRVSRGKRFKSLPDEKKVIFIPDNTIIHV